MLNASLLYGVALLAVPVMLSLTLHEWGHARTALAFGDPTAAALGRTSLNPLRHLDPLGTICLLFGPVGWAKPVPVDHTRLRPYRIGDICVSLAGVGMNLMLLIGAAVALNVLAAAGLEVDPSSSAANTRLGIAVFMLFLLLRINLALIVFNLIPLYPLDGHHVLRELLPSRLRMPFMEWQMRLGRLLLMAALFLPWILGTVSPIGWALHRISGPIQYLLLTDGGEMLSLSALIRYYPYLPW